MSTRTRRDWVLWGALACTLVGAAHAEYTLAVATGVHPWVAACVPGALDLYVIRALQVRRDVLLAVLVMCSVNVASHLVTAGVLTIGWELISAVGALAPLVLWRVHALWHTRTRTELLWDVPAGTRETVESTPVPEPEHTPNAPELDAEPAPAEAYPAVPDYVPDPWFEEHEPSMVPSTPATDTTATSPTPEYTPSTSVIEVLQDGDAEYAGALKAYLDTCTEEGRTPSLRGCKDFCKVGQDRAKRLLSWAGYTS